MDIGQSTVQPSATQLDGLCHILADRCSFREIKKEKKGEMGSREETSVGSFLVYVCFSIFLNNVRF